MSQVDINIEDLKKMAENIATNTAPHHPHHIVNPVETKQLQPVMKRRISGPIKKVQLQVPKHQANSENVSSTSDDVDKIMGADGKVRTKSIDVCGNSMTIMGLNIPKHTFYLSLVLVLIAVAIWYTSRDKTKKKKKQNDEDDEEE